MILKTRLHFSPTKTCAHKGTFDFDFWIPPQMLSRQRPMFKGTCERRHAHTHAENQTAEELALSAKMESQ